MNKDNIYFTPTEKRVYELLILGFNNLTIQEKLKMSVRTLKFHITHIYEKMAVTSRPEFMAAHYMGYQQFKQARASA